MAFGRSTPTKATGRSGQTPRADTSSGFYDRFDAVVLLSAPAQVLLSRIETRTNNPYGKTAARRELMLGDVAAVEPRLPRTCTHEIDATRPLADVVTQLAELGRDPSA